MHQLFIYYHYLLYNFPLFFFRSFLLPVHGKDVVNGLNGRYKQMLKLAIKKLFNPELIQYDPIFLNFVQVHKNGENQAVSLVKEDKRVLSLLHARYINNNKRQENVNFSNRHYHIQDINNMQH